MLRCTVCQSPAEQALCQDCHQLMIKPTYRCYQCGKPLPNTDATQCGECMTSPPEFDTVIYATLYQYPVDRWVHQLKFGQQLSAAQLMADSLIPLLSSIAVEVPLIPVPLHPRRLLLRGYNQAAMIAQSIAKAENRKLITDVLFRPKNTQMQAALRAKQRKNNVSGAFGCLKPLDADRILLVDDVLTTGQTLRACAKALKQNGVRQVTALVFARSRG